MGSLAARWRGGVADKSLVTGSLVVSSFPYYVVCLLAWIYRYLIWGVFPKTEYHSVLHSPLAWAGGLLLPWLVHFQKGDAGDALFGVRRGQGCQRGLGGREFLGSDLAEHIRQTLRDKITEPAASYNLVFTQNGIACTTASIIAATQGLADPARR